MEIVPRLDRTRLAACNGPKTSVTLGRLTPSMSAKNSCDSFISSESTRSLVINSQRQHRCSMLCMPLQAIPCMVCVRKLASWRRANLRSSSLIWTACLNRSMLTRCPLPPTCTKERYGTDSVVSVLESGASIEVGTVGREGMALKKSRWPSSDGPMGRTGRPRRGGRLRPGEIGANGTSRETTCDLAGDRHEQVLRLASALRQGQRA